MIRRNRNTIFLVTKPLFGDAVSCVPNEGIGNEELLSTGNEGNFWNLS